MRRGTRLLAGLTVFGLIASASLAQMSAPKPGPELKKADYFVGSWKLDGDMKPGPMGPGGQMSMTEECRWMEGGFFVVCHSKFSSKTTGSGSGVAIMGYDIDGKNYSYDEYNSMGEAVHSTGALNGDTWTWTSDEKWEGKTFKGRFTMKIASPTSYSFQYEMSPDGSNWTTVMDGKAAKTN